MAPARVATSALYHSTFVSKLYAVGFGISKLAPGLPSGDPLTAGVKLYAPLQITDKICGTERARITYRCYPGREAVLIDLAHDTCGGDSGGPIFAVVGAQYFLIGITSRAIKGSRCDSGGIYSLVTPAVMAWIRNNGVFLHSVPFDIQ